MNRTDYILYTQRTPYTIHDWIVGRTFSFGETWEDGATPVLWDVHVLNSCISEGQQWLKVMDYNADILWMPADLEGIVNLSKTEEEVAERAKTYEPENGINYEKV